MAEDAVELGYTTIIHSAELNKVIPLSKSAYNMHLSLADTSHFDTYNPKDVVLLGDSRGAMIGFGFAAYAKQFDVKIRGGQLVDPCVAHPIGLEDVKHIPEYAQHLLEGYSLFRQVGRLTLTQIIRYSKTLRPEVRFMLQQARIGQPIFSGEAGNLGRAIPKNQELDVLLFTKSTANHAANWREMFKNSSIRLEERSGTHLSIANPLTRMTKLITLDYLRYKPQAA